MDSVRNIFGDEHGDDCPLCRYHCSFGGDIEVPQERLYPSMVDEAERAGQPLVPPGPVPLHPAETDGDIVIGTADEIDAHLSGRHG